MKAPPRDYPRRTPKKMFLAFSDLRATDFFFSKGQDIFSVFCPQGLGQASEENKIDLELLSLTFSVSLGRS